ncbi:hypothetical protein [Gracilibacillus thailandensis]|uniref:Lipoprotein n=1 Tax=Gracilibacillus thailandensis TaxID=563735 RepID=A0A6N7R2X2_9BACI|nr:hypothetical protein [Gracilibacillus thailandensis]MRI67609.1 hypothetical protein [Gracilibacillus thailandensis]
MKYKKPLYFIMIIIFVVGIVGCTPSRTDIDSLNNKDDIVELNEGDKSVEVLNRMDLTKSSNSHTRNNSSYRSYKGFIFDENHLEVIKLRNENETFKFVKLDSDNSTLSGKLKFENNTNESMQIRSLFLQGNKNVKIKPISLERWSKGIFYEIPAKTSVSIQIEINVNKNDMNELTFFPFEMNTDPDFYNGINIAANRYYMEGENSNREDEEISKHSFNLTDGEEMKYPTPVWVNQDKEELELINKNGAILSKEKIRALRFDAVPYDTIVDIILLDEFGNTEILEENKELKKDKNNFVDFGENIIDNFYDNDGNRKFILVLNNRENEMLSDVLAFGNKKSPFPTSFQRILEIYPLAK